MFITPSTFIDFITKVSDIISETNDHITPSTSSDFPFLAPPPRLFQPPRLLER